MFTFPHLPVFPWLGVICRAVSVVRAPLVAAIAAAFVLSTPDQIIELYRVQGEKAAGDRAIAILGVVLVSALLVFLGHALVKLNGQEICNQSRIACVLLRVLPGLCGAILAMGAAVGMWRASCSAWFTQTCKGAWSLVPQEVLTKVPQLDAIRVGMQEVLEEFKFHGTFLIMIAALAIVLGVYLGRNYRTLHSADIKSPRRRWGLLGWARVAIVVVLVGTEVHYYQRVPEFTGIWAFGTTGVFLLFVAMLAYIGSMATGWLDQYRIPAITGLLLVVLSFSFLDLNDNHEVELLVSDEATKKAPAINTAFIDWYKARADRDQFRDKPYPVFIVATAGGGLYAAQHTATFLSRMQDRCPSFSQHTFAISSVSGGSLGAAVFAGLAGKSVPNSSYVPCKFDASTKPGPLEDRARKILNRDFLTPLVGAMLFPDFVQRFWPSPIKTLSRGRALDANIAAAWAYAEDGEDGDAPATPANANPFNAGLQKLWQPASSAPALFLNATEVTDGRRFIMAPMTLRWDDPDPSKTFDMTPRWSAIREYIRHFDESTNDLALASAVRISASFPWITPAASMELTRSHDDATQRFKLRLVDGGFFENSGVETAHDVYGYLKRFETKPSASDPPDQPWIKLHFILIGGYLAVSDNEYNRLSHGLGELLSPVKSLLNARERRGYLAWYRFSLAQCGEMWELRKCPVLSSSLNLTDFHIPLGWRLSPLTTELIAVQAGRAERTSAWLKEDYDLNSDHPDRRVRAKETIFGWMQENDESACNIALILGGRPVGEIVAMRQKDDVRRNEVLAKGTSSLPGLAAADTCSAR